MTKILVFRERLLFNRREAVLRGLSTVAGCICVLLFAGSCATNNPSSQDTPSYPAGANNTNSPSILLIGNEKITCDEIITSPVRTNEGFVSLADSLMPLAKTNTLEQFKEWARPRVEEVVNDRISNVFLYEQAKRQAPENIDEALDKAAQKELRLFIMNFGGDEAKADEALKQMKMDRKSFLEQQKKLILTQSYVASKISNNKPLTYGELMQYYNEIKESLFVIPAMIRFRLIDIQPAKLQLEQPQQNPLELARDLANKLVARIRTGEDFAELAKQYSHGYRREFGGLWYPMQPDSLAEPYNVLAEAAKTIEPGQIAGPIEVTGHIFIMKLEEKREKSYEPFEKVQAQLEQKVMLNRRRQASDRLRAELAEQVPLSDKDRFIDFCLERIYQMKENPPVKPGG